MVIEILIVRIPKIVVELDTPKFLTGNHAKIC